MYAAQNVRDENGESIIPASQRPDGTWRKARRVKEGYVPQEEVPLYESKGKQFATRSTAPATVTLPTGQVAHQSIPGLFIVNEKAKSKNKKKPKNVENTSKQLEKLKITEKVNKPKPPSNKSTKQEQPEKVAPTEAVDPAKRLKNLNKRLREIEAIETKLKNGEISKPEPEQLTKVQRKNDLLLQIRELEKLL